MEDRSGPGIDRPGDAGTATAASGITSDASYPIRRTTGKRSFDVAFLVAPDEKLARRQTDYNQLETCHSPDFGSPVSPSGDTCYRTFPGNHHPPGSHHHHHHSEELTGSRSAFTKVSSSSSFDESRSSPRSSISPDRGSYRSSISPPRRTPPLQAACPIKTALFKYGSFAAVAAAAASAPYPFIPSSPESVTPITTASATVTNTSLVDNVKIRKMSNRGQPSGIRAPSDLSPAAAAVYSNLSYGPISVFPSAPMAEALTRPRHLFGVTGLLPPSFALSLPAQNVCAKCNLSFRMTSDLVYHMRSHHKNEGTGEAARRRREEKLRCPVCDESFRERHHLTRHMTAHQDKESDVMDQQSQPQVQLSNVKRRTGASGLSAVVHGAK